MGPNTSKPVRVTYIVELEPGCWYADCVGDPGRTTVRENAQRFSCKRAAQCALDWAREWRPFVSAQIVEVEQ